MSRAGAWLPWALGLGAMLACAGSLTGAGDGGSPGYLHNRGDYEAFRVQHPALIEPNYLPFMAWRLGVEDSEEEWLAFCRWPRDAFPLAVHVAAPEIAVQLQDELRPVQPQVYVDTARRALAVWSAELEGLVSFRVVEHPDQARLVLRLIADQAPVPDPGVKVLGTTPLGDACRVLSRGDRGQRLRVEFEVEEFRVYIADEFGLLNADQVERITLHEIGHALGMRGHSPVPNDLMFERVRERPGRASLSAQDVNSFVSLYALPQGLVYRDLSRPGAAPAGSSEPPEGPPRLALAPHVDARLGFEMQLPEGWLKVGTSTGFVTIDGVTWDYAASLQLIVRRFPSVDAYLRRHAAAHVRDGTIVEQGPAEVAGQPAFRLVVEAADRTLVDEITVIESGDGRVVVVIADCRPDECEAYRPWFQAALATLEIRSGEGHDREYRPVPEP